MASRINTSVMPAVGAVGSSPLAAVGAKANTPLGKVSLCFLLPALWRSLRIQQPSERITG